MTATAPSDTDGSTTGAPPEEYVGEEMTLFEHLEELRQRLFKSAAAIALGFVVGFAVRNQVFDILVKPYCELPARLRSASSVFDPGRCTLIFTDVMGAFFISLKAAAMVAIIVAAPVVFYQLWRFITPGLRPVEKRYALPFVVLTQLLFVGGAVFSYYVIPRGLEFLLSFAGDNVSSLMDANRYLTFLIQTMLAFGLTFEFPLVVALLTIMGVVGTQGLRQYRRHALLGAFVLSAFITPTQDPFTMVVLALPLAVFYECNIVFARILDRRRGPVGDPTSGDPVSGNPVGA